MSFLWASAKRGPRELHEGLGVESSVCWIPDHDDGRTQEEGVHQWQNVFREDDVKAGSRRELSHGNGPGNTTRLILAHAPDFDFWPTCQGGTGVGLDVGQDPVGLLIESVAVWSEGVDVANALRKLVILRRTQVG